MTLGAFQHYIVVRLADHIEMILHQWEFEMTSTESVSFMNEYDWRSVQPDVTPAVPYAELFLTDGFFHTGWFN